MLTLFVQKFPPLNISNLDVLKINKFRLKTVSYTWKISKYNHMKNECTMTELKSIKNGFPNNSYFIKKIIPPGLSDDHTYF